MTSESSATPLGDRPYIGGQALIEGVMMRSPKGLAVAVRKPDGSIIVKDEKLPSEHSGMRKWPFFRGVLQLGEAFSVGYRALQFSAEQQMTEEEKAKSASGGMMAGAISILIAAVLFIGAPQGLATGLFDLLGLPVELGSWQFHALTGLFKLTIITGYLGAVSLIPEMRRVFQYHGAEHKTIYAWESGKDLTVANVRAESTLHPRCGTTFLVTVVIVSAVLGAVMVPLLLPNASGWTGQLMTYGLRLAMLPLIAAISYELQRFSAKYCTRGPLRVLLYPGFLFQKITTREPDDTQIEVAIAAMQGAFARETENEVAERSRTFGSFREAQAGLVPTAAAA